MEEVIRTQNQIKDAVSKIFINFKKDGADRKTSQHAKRRLENLEAYWKDFQYNHEVLLNYEVQDHAYFIEDELAQVQASYNITKSYLEQYLTSQSENERATLDTPKVKTIDRPSTSKNQTSSIQYDPPSHKIPIDQTMVHRKPIESINNGKQNQTIKEFMRKQNSNFKAFTRTIAQISLKTLSEKWEFQDVLRIVENRWSAIDVLHWEIDSQLDLEDQEYDELFTKYERQYIEIKKDINSRMWDASHREKATPQIDLPTFCGNYQEWISFKDLFNETIHMNRSISNAQKMQFLKSKLRGEAEKLIQHLRISSENYQISWELLNHRYNNQKLIFNHHMNVLMSMPEMKQQSSAQIKRIHDTTNECLNAIKNMGIDIKSWDPLIVYLVSQKLDPESHGDYIESLVQPRELPTLEDFLSYLEGKFIALETARRKQEFTKPPKQYQNNQQKPHYLNRYKSEHKNSGNYSSTKSINNKKCPLCSEVHALFLCKKFRQLNNKEKINIISNYNICENCLFNHNGNSCTSEKTCRHCKEKHNTLLHNALHVSPVTNASPESVVMQTKSKSHVTQGTSEILLPTAMVKVRAADGSYYTMRALIDQGSQTSLITEKAAQKLEISRQWCKGVIYGIGTKENICKGVINVAISSLQSDFTINVDTFIMKNLINKLPNQSFIKPSWTYLDQIELADPQFYKSRQVDLLLGAEVYASIMLHGIRKEDIFQPIAQHTHFGWILCGNVTSSYHCNVVINNNEEIKQFWDIEEPIDGSDDLSLEDNLCILQYQSETKRQPDGRYVVRLPLKPEIGQKLGDSRKKAIAQFHQLENKFSNKKHIAQDYIAFIKEYINLGHMQLSTRNNQIAESYLPHHCVMRADSTTTATRVVFNASAKTSTGYSVNDLMYSGPNLQQDLVSLIIKWRQYRIAFTADIEKMFRQILINDNDQRYQKIIWRDSPEQPLREYKLMTVTYGTKAAPFLAMMTLKQLAKDEEKQYPEASKVLENSFYMDDLLHGHHNIDSAKKLQAELMNLLKSGGFNLRKWTSNAEQLLDDPNDIRRKEQTFEFKHQESTKTLGLRWHPHKDEFTFQAKISSLPNEKLTKRTLLSDISKVFDPLGWISPVTIKHKLLFQQVWKLDLNWDDILPKEIIHDWNTSKSDLQFLDTLQIPRWLHCHQNNNIELHGFCDASTKAYACVIYCKVTQTINQKSSVVILAAKSRLVPIKRVVTLPRLELCAAHLLSKLMQTVHRNLSNYNIKIFGWSDSTAVLGWINGDPNKWKPFVGNRVKQITEIMPRENWSYVKSLENPADCASRGLTTERLSKHEIWWNGPQWLASFNYQNIKTKPNYVTQEEIKRSAQTNVVTTPYENDIINKLIYKYSNFTRTYRVLAWILRALPRNTNKTTYLTTTEIKKAKYILIKQVQEGSFIQEINNLKNNYNIDSNSKLISLNPFIDEFGLLRVGGRIKHANISDDQKHPIILPHTHHLTDIIIEQAHKKNFHAGARLTLAELRRQFWIIGGNNAVKKQLRQCIKCRKTKFEIQNQLMGDLPSARTNPTRPFYHTGVDYTGYVDVKSSKGRGVKCTKGYVAVFVCMVTKAVHLELVSDLSSSAFIAALRRLSARRGSPGHIYSDNGTNFVGANTKIQKEIIHQKLTIMNDAFFNTISDMEIRWHFNAPSWPSAGGLWEASVKSLKYHLQRVLGDQKLTYEEFNTLLVQLEGCLNSRPLCAISEDPDDINFLTPSHFLSSGPLLTIIETEKDERTRWHLTQKNYHDIWKRWQSEYLTQLSIRSKWKKPIKNFEINDIAMIHDTHSQPGKWALGRVLELHPGSDGLVRVVTLKTKGGTIKRPITKLSFLPIDKKPELLNQTTQQSTTHDKKFKAAGQPLKHPKPRKTCCNFITMALLLFISLISPITCNLQVTALRNNQTIYFDQLNNLKLIRDEWKLVVFYDMNSYWQSNELAEKYINHLEQLCERIKIKTHCDLILLHLRHCFSELKYYNKILFNQNFPSNQNRPRRGLINAVGNVAHSLFGVLDEQFAEQYQNDIAMIRENQKHLALLWKNQTSIVESEYNLLQRMEGIINKHHKIFNQHINNLEKRTNTIQTEMQELEQMNEFSLSSITANGIIMNLKSIQDTLLDTITNISNEKFNIHLLSPDQLISELNLISGQISSELSLPIENVHSDLPQIYHLLTAKARMTSTYLFIEIKIPLVSRDRYQLYHLIPIPKPVDHNMIVLEPIADHIAINLEKDSFIPLTENEIQTCSHYHSKLLLCPTHKPIYTTKFEESLCVKDQISQKCKVGIIECKDTWIPLSKLNTFLYSCCKQCIIKMICKDHISVERLDKAGIVTLQSGCVIKSDNITFFTHKQQTNNISIKPSIVPIIIPPINEIINLRMPEMSSNYQNTSINQSELINIGNQINHIKQEANKIVEESNQLSSHDIHHYVISYLICGGLVAAAIMYVVRRVRGRDRRRPQEPAPAARPLQLLAGSGLGPPKPPREQRSLSDQCLSDQKCYKLENKIYIDSAQRSFSDQCLNSECVSESFKKYDLSKRAPIVSPTFRKFIELEQ